MDETEPPVGAQVVEGAHSWRRRDEDTWVGCIACGDGDLEWSWQDIRAEIGHARARIIWPYRRDGV